MEKVQIGRSRRAARARPPRPRGLGRDERAKILRVQNLLAKAHSTRLSGAPRPLA
jgi:hypothetical protein